MTQKILEALAKLDSNNDAHWTSEGLPRLETVRFFAADNTLNREAVTLAAPSFVRHAPLEGATAQQGTQQAAQAAIAAQAPTGTGSTPPAAPAGDTPAASESNSEGDNGEQEGGIEGAGAAPGAAGDTQEPATAEAEDRLEAARARFNAAERAAAQANQELAQAAKELDAELDAQNKQADPQDLSRDIQAYHASQRRLLLQRAEQRQALSNAGIRLSDLLPMRSKLDSALQRRTERGTQRPKFSNEG